MSILLPVLGGLGLFLYGMNLMGVGLEKAAGDKMKKLIEVLTNNRIMGVLVGAGVTMIIQSSSATTVMVIGFVNAGLMTLTQAVGVIMGANIGTTVTAHLIAFNLTDYAPLAVAVGVGIWLMASKKKSKDIAEILIGFGILFMGMDMMSNGLAPLADSPVFKNIMVSLESPFLGVIVGLGLTTILQSSSASIGLLQALASQGLITLNIAFPILFGDNIGTTTTAMLSSVGANKTAKRAAVMHFLFNAIGTILFMTILRKPVETIALMISPTDIQRQIATAHTLFNIVNVLVQLPFAGLLVKMAEKLVPGELEDDDTTGSKYLDERIISTPTIALGQVTKEVVRMGHKVEKNLVRSKEAFKNKDMDRANRVFEVEKTINDIEKDIVEYLVKLSNAPLLEEQHIKINIIMNIVNDIERIGDHADNIAELSMISLEEDLYFSEGAFDELDNIFDLALDVFTKSIKSFEEDNYTIAKEVMLLEEKVNMFEREYRNNHIERVNKQLCKPNAGVIFLDVLSNLERVSDHSSNIAYYVLDSHLK